MIVKNEAHVIERCLRSVRPLIDTWCVVDTGSSDGTQTLVQEALRDVPGQLHERSWVDFAHNRTEAVALGRPLADYTFTIDADEELIVADGVDLDAAKRSLTAGRIDVSVEFNGIAYERASLFRNDLRFYYRGVLHEFLDCHDPIDAIGRLEGVRIQVHPEGARSQNPNKFSDDAKVLERALRTESDPLLQARYRFYLAQSYRDAGRPGDALRNYEQRTTMGGWTEEVCVSLMECGHQSQRLKRPHKEALDYYLRAHETSPQRGEPLYYAAKLCRDNERLQLCYALARRGIELQAPADALFSEPDVYDWRLRFELSVAAWYAGRHAEGREACEALLANPRVPADIRERTLSNLTFYGGGGAGSPAQTA